MNHQPNARCKRAKLRQEGEIKRVAAGEELVLADGPLESVVDRVNGENVEEHVIAEVGQDVAPQSREE